MSLFFRELAHLAQYSLQQKCSLHSLRYLLCLLEETKKRKGRGVTQHTLTSGTPECFPVFPESFSFIQISVKLHTVSEKRYTVVDETMTLILYRSSFDKTATCFFRHVNPSDISQTLSWQIIM